MTSSFQISVIITTYNRSDALLAVLNGLLHQTDKNFETIVADDGSRAEHAQAIQLSPVAKSLKIAHVWHPDVGFTASRVRNRGVAASTGSYLIFLDGDCVPEVDFIARHRALAVHGCFVNGSRILLSEGFSQKIIQSGIQISGRSKTYWIGQRILKNVNKFSGFLRLPNGNFRMDHGKPWTRIRSCNMATWRHDFESVNGFDESFVGWGHEDADFALRLHHAGILRRNGFWATEVFHLWHKEASRTHASQNAETVAQRVQTDITLPTLGYAQDQLYDDVTITRLG
jgi:GT2 family glycosyltransferase